jgi:hypothetical protein
MRKPENVPILEADRVAAREFFALLPGQRKEAHHRGPEQVGTLLIRGSDAPLIAGV